MKVERHYSMIHSEKVLKIIRRLAKRFKPKDVGDYMLLDNWSNGREQGFHISRDQKGVCFAQQRNSDSILVICGTAMEFDISTNMPSDEAWNRHNPCFNDDEKAARHIVKFIVGK